MTQFTTPASLRNENRTSGSLASLLADRIRREEGGLRIRRLPSPESVMAGHQKDFFRLLNVQILNTSAAPVSIPAQDVTRRLSEGCRLSFSPDEGHGFIRQVE
jgi:hypothetical protein